jgi:glycosyltransferase involved in cell wall biosynthesis
VVSLSGTDVHLDLAHPEFASVIREVIAHAGAVVAQERQALEKIAGCLPEARARAVYVPKSFRWLGDQPFDLRAMAGLSPADLVFFHPAGLRPVKGVLEALEAFEDVYERRPDVRIVFAGPPLDEAYARRFFAEVERRTAYARYLPAIPLACMRAAYRSVDVVLNASRAEGLANALIEAAASGCPVLASDVPGNRRLVLEGGPEGPFGLLFDPSDRGDLVAKALRLAEEGPLRAVLSRAALAAAGRRPTPDEEAEALLAAYALAANRTPRAGGDGGGGRSCAHRSAGR